MAKSQQADGVIVQGPGVDRAYDEALALAIRARSCIARGVGDRGLSRKESLVYSAETMRLSSRIMHVMAWGLYHKAFEAGEIDRKTLESQRCRLGDEVICLAANEDTHVSLPDWVHDLMDQSARLYRRALRLQAMLDQQTCH